MGDEELHHDESAETLFPWADTPDPDLSDAAQHGAPAQLPPERPGELPRPVVRARTPLTAQSLVERADVAPRTPEAEAVLRIFRRRRQEHAAFYVGEMRDLALLWCEGDESDEKALHALAAAAGLRAKLTRGDDRLRDAHVAVTDLPACFARVEEGALPVEWFEWLLRSTLRLTSHQRRQVDERVAAWQLEAIDVERFYRELRHLLNWFGRAAVEGSAEEKRSVFFQASPDGDGTACLTIRGPIPEILALGRRLDAAARAVQDAQRRALANGAPIPFDQGGEAARQGKQLPLEALRYAIATRSALDTGSIEVPEPAFRISLVVPALSLFGLTDAPATLDGTIPVPAAMARDLVAKAPAFERVLTDPITGAFLPGTSKTYRPSAAMAENLRLIDPVCAAPGCTRNVMTIGEADHIEEFDLENPSRGGPTSVENLHRLCRSHHRMKTAGLLDPDRDEDSGLTRWRLGDAAVCEVPLNRDLVTRELSDLLENMWEKYRCELEFDALLRLGVAEETPEEIADALEAQRWGEHLTEYWTNAGDDSGEDAADDSGKAPGPPPLPPTPGYGPPPF